MGNQYNCVRAIASPDSFTVRVEVNDEIAKRFSAAIDAWRKPGE